MPQQWTTEADEDEETYECASIVHYEYGDPYRVHIGDAEEECEESDPLEFIARVEFPEPLTLEEACRYEVNNASEFTQHVPEPSDLQSSAEAALNRING